MGFQYFLALRTALFVGSWLFGEVVSVSLSVRRSPHYQHSFHFPLPIPPVKKSLAAYTNPKTGVPIDFYEIEAKEFSSIFYPNLEPAKLFGYDGIYPGPTFRIEKGRETVVRVVNKGQRKMNAHLHGSYCKCFV
jgi:bilirubin oxidase